MEQVAFIMELFRRAGGSMYGFEAVTQVEHGLQAAALAEKEQATPALICAALLHDVGHLLHDLPDHAPEMGIDDLHESLGARFLERYFIPEVAEPVRLHVLAKRYLCTTEPEYLQQLSEPSVISLKLQGGLMNLSEQEEFLQNPYAQDAIRLRRWDDLAKDPEWKCPPLEHYEAMLRACLLPVS